MFYLYFTESLPKKVQVISQFVYMNYKLQSVYVNEKAYPGQKYNKYLSSVDIMYLNTNLLIQNSGKQIDSLFTLSKFCLGLYCLKRSEDYLCQKNQFIISS